MQINNEQLISELIIIVENAQQTARSLKTLPIEKLNFKASPVQWSALACIEHLNLYGDFYLPEMENRMLGQQPAKNPVFTSGLIGNYFAKLMQVKDGKMKKMKSPGDKNPGNSLLTITTIDRFIKQLELLKTLLRRATVLDLTRIKTSISLTKYIKTRLGDTFRFVIYHIERHMLQAENSVEASRQVRASAERPSGAPLSSKPNQTIVSRAM